MAVPAVRTDPDIIEYPESDGRPMADNTLQFRWIVTIQGGLDDLFREDESVFVAGDLLWYPVEGNPSLSTAPDVLVAVGRPKGDRRSYLQWREGNIAPQVVFEILSASNTAREMNQKFVFYDRYGVEEYYLYDPEANDLTGWVRSDGHLLLIDPVHGWVSPRLGTRFDTAGSELVIYRPDGRPFLTYLGQAARSERAEQERALAEQERDEERRRAERLAARLREAGIDPAAV